MSAASTRRPLAVRARNARFKLARWARRRRDVRRVRRLQDAHQRGLGARRVAAAYARRHGTEVRRGPFAGLRYPARSPRRVDHLVAKLVGAYEQELAPALTRALAAPPEHFVDVGCADGYYAVGVARRAPEATVHAFDLDPVARRLCRGLARHNGVAGRVSVRGYCDAATLRDLPLAGALVLSDCEGGEVELFTPETVALMGTTTALVELHELTGEGEALEAEARLLERFAATHAAQLFESGPRDPARYGELADLEPGDRAIALDELRPRPMRWALFTPKAGA